MYILTMFDGRCFAKCVVAWTWAARIIVRFIFILHLLSTFLCSISAITSAMPKQVYTWAFVPGTQSLWRNQIEIRCESHHRGMVWLTLVWPGFIAVHLCVWSLYSNSLSATAPLCCRCSVRKLFTAYTMMMMLPGASFSPAFNRMKINFLLCLCDFSYWISIADNGNT